jgi:hypothetical protein
MGQITAYMATIELGWPIILAGILTIGAVIVLALKKGK